MATSELEKAMFAQHNSLDCGQSVGCQINNPGEGLRRLGFLNLSVQGKLPAESQGAHKMSHINYVAERTSENARIYNSTPTHQFHPQSHNSFLLEPEVSKDKNEDLDGENLHKYCEDFFLQLHGNFKESQDTAIEDTTVSSPFYNSQCTATVCNSNPNILQQNLDCSETQSQHSWLHHRRDSKETPMLMECEELDWGDDDYNEYIERTVSSEKLKGNSYVYGKACSDCDSSSQNQYDYISDSSCNSSDGVLVNFSAIYNKTNNAVPATPYDLDSPAMKTTSQTDNVIFSGSARRVDPNCNIYELESNALSSLEISDLSNCLESQERLLASTNSYYKLVNCDLLSQSPTSPGWSTMSSCSEANSQTSLIPPTEYFLFRKPEGEEEKMVTVDEHNLQASRDSELQRNKRNIRKVSRETKETKAYTCMRRTNCRDSEINSNEDTGPTQKALPEVLDCLRQVAKSVDAPKQPKTCFAEIAQCKKSKGDLTALKNSREASTCIQPNQNQEHPLMQRKTYLGQNVLTNQNEQDLKRPQSSRSCDGLSARASALSLEVVHYSKAQRPTSLPIQPFVLQPTTEKQSSKILGSLLDQYMSHKGKQPGVFKCKGLAKHLRPSPFGSNSFMHLEVASSTDTCSSCTPTPVQPYIQLHWAPPSQLFFHRETDRSSNHPEQKQPKNNPNKDKTIPTSQQLSTVQEQSLLKQKFFDQVRSLQTSSELLSLKQRSQQNGVRQYSSSPASTSVTSAGQRPPCVSDAQEFKTSAVSHFFLSRNLHCILEKESHQHGDSSSVTDKPPEEFCLSPDACTKILSIDLLQKKDMLKSVSLAVDLIAAHFSSCREPHKKISLGSRSQCPNISKLVLDQFCPAIRNLLQDGLRPFKLDLIVGQRRIKAWSAVEAFTQPGPSNPMLHSLVSVVKKCPDLTDHSMRLNAFFMGLLNLSALESWFCHLHTCVDVITEYYHPWAFLALSQESAFKYLYQELVFLLQPLSLLPFNLHLLSESKLQRRLDRNQPFIRQSRLPEPSVYTFPWRPNSQNKDGCLERQDCGVTFSKQLSVSQDAQKSVSVGSAEKKCAGWWLSQASISEGKHPVTTPNINNEILVENRERAARFPLESEEDNPKAEWRWARLFGSGIGTVAEKRGNTHQTQKTRPPSQWLKLGASKMDQLAQLAWSTGMISTLHQCEPQPEAGQ